MSRTFAMVAFAAISSLIGASDAIAARLELCSDHGRCIEDTCLCDPGLEG